MHAGNVLLYVKGFHGAHSVAGKLCAREAMFNTMSMFNLFPKGHVKLINYLQGFIVSYRTLMVEVSIIHSHSKIINHLFIWCLKYHKNMYMHCLV